MEKKTVDEEIFKLRETLKQVIVQSELSPAVIELVIRDIYIDIKQLSEQNLMRILNEKKQKEGDSNGEHTTVS